MAQDYKNFISLENPEEFHLSSQEIISRIADGSILFCAGQMDLLTLLNLHELYKKFDKTAAIAPFPIAESGQGPAARVGQAYIVLQGSREKEAAALFLRGVVEGWYQNASAKDCPNIFSEEKQRLFLEETPLDSPGQADFIAPLYLHEINRLTPPLPSSLIDCYFELENQVKTAASDGEYLYQQIVLPEMTPYFEERSSLDDCIEALQNKLTLYLNE